MLTADRVLPRSALETLHRGLAIHGVARQQLRNSRLSLVNHYSNPDHSHHITCALKGVRVSAKTDEDDDEAPAPGKPLRVERLLANLGYGNRKECQALVQKGRALRRDGSRLKVGDKVLHMDILLDDEEVDPPCPVVVMVNKPVGYVVTAPDDVKVLDPKVYDLLPGRFSQRRPSLASIGRLDKATSGLLLMTDDGQLVHRVSSPKYGIWKVYEARLAAPLQGKDAEAAARRYASGTLMLDKEVEPLLPAKLEMVADNIARVSICEGRYHQVRRMFAAIGHEVVALQRVSVGGLSLDGLPDGEWKYLTQSSVDAVFAGPTMEDMMPSDVAALEAGGTGRPVVLSKVSKRAVLDTALDGFGSTTAPASLDSRVAKSSRGEVVREEGSEYEGEDGSSEEMLINPSSRVKKVREDEKWRRRREALKKMVNNM